MPLILYPAIPAVPGVPALNRSLNQAGIGIVGGAESIASTLGLSGDVSFGNRIYASILLDSLGSGQLPQYAVLDSSNNSVLVPDSAVELDYQADSGIMTHPIEQGQFSAYNRVQEPQAIRLMLACQGKNMPRAAFLSTLGGLREGTQLVTIVTPDMTYRNMALKSFGYRKSAERGAVTIWADTEWLEARSTGVTVVQSSSSQPYGAATNDLGSLQPQTPTNSQAAAIANPSVAPVPVPARLIEEMPPSGDAF